MNLKVTGSVGNTILYYPELGSTFDMIQSLPPKDGLTVVCSRQTCGSGRMGRKWESPDGGIYFTFELHEPFNGFDISLITPVCALGVQKALNKYVQAKIKWPNDIVSGGKKLCGILTKIRTSGDKITCLFVGIGINANIAKFPAELCHASSLKLLCGKDIDENTLLEDVLCEINKVYAMRTADVLAMYKAACVNMNKEVIIHFADGREDEKGICTDILPDGSMNVQTPKGTINVHSGEVSVKGVYGVSDNC